MSFCRRLRDRVAELHEFCREHGYNTHVALLADFSRHSGLRRFVVWDFSKAEALYS